MEHFCDNPECEHYKMTDQHSCDIGRYLVSIGGLNRKEIRRYLYSDCNGIPRMHFCDVCHSAIEMTTSK